MSWHICRSTVVWRRFGCTFGFVFTPCLLAGQNRAAEPLFLARFHEFLWDGSEVNVLLNGGFYQGAVRPEVDQINYAPRVTIPTLMLNGRYDFTFPSETSHRPMFRQLGTPSEHKHHALYDSGHAVPFDQSTNEILAWLDRYLGPVK